MANMMRGRVPIYREDRSIFADEFSDFQSISHRHEETELPPDVGPAPFEITAAYRRTGFRGSDGATTCSGGGAEAAFRLSPQWQLVADVSGCTLGGLPQLVTGDALSYLIGPRWTPSEKRLRPYAQFLIGGTKLTTEKVWPEKKAIVEAAAREAGERPNRDEFVKTDANHSLAVSAGMGLDLKLGRAAALKLASLEYTRSWNAPVAGVDYSRGLQLKLGVTLRMGTW
jgi:hypothetical protein